MHIDEKQLKEFIIDSGLVSRADLDKASDEAKKRKEHLGQYLISSGKLTDDDLRRMHAYLLGIPFVDLKNSKIPFSSITKLKM